MRTEAASAEFYASPLEAARRFITVADLLAGKGIDYPVRIGSAFRQAPRAKSKAPARPESLFGAESADKPPECQGPGEGEFAAN